MNKKGYETDRGIIHMRKVLRKMIVVTAAVVTLVGGSLFVADTGEAALRDVQSGSFYQEPVNHLIREGVITGYSDNTFRPNNSVTRAEVANMLYKVLGLDDVTYPNPVFPDVRPGIWYTQPVAALSSNGIVGGFTDGTFRPNGNITRAEMATMIVNAYEELEVRPGATTRFTDVKAGVWYTGTIAALVEGGITQGKTATTFAPNDIVTRAEAATFIYRAEKLKEDSQLEVIDIR